MGTYRSPWKLERHRIRNKNKRLDRQEQGLCVRCGKPRGECMSLSWCVACDAIMRKRRAKQSGGPGKPGRLGDPAIVHDDTLDSNTTIIRMIIHELPFLYTANDVVAAMGKTQTPLDRQQATNALCRLAKRGHVTIHRLGGPQVLTVYRQ